MSCKTDHLGFVIASEAWRSMHPDFLAVIPDSIRDPVLRRYWIAGRGPQ